MAKPRKPTSSKPSGTNDQRGVEPELRQRIVADVQKLAAWVKKNSIEDLRTICTALADHTGHAATGAGARDCWPVLDRMLPSGADQIVHNLLTRPTEALLDLLAEVVPELARPLRAIAYEFAPRIIIAGSSDDPRIWDTLKAELCTSHSGVQELSLTFTRQDQQTFTVRGTPRSAIGDVLPKIMNVLAKADAPALDDKEVEAFVTSARLLEKRVRRAKARSGT